MEGINLAWLFALIKEFGIVGLVIILWWVDSKKVYKILDRYKADVTEARRMYESNVKLVRAYESVAGDLKDIVVMNTQALTKLNDNIKTNQYCPQVRLEKKAKGVQSA